MGTLGNALSEYTVTHISQDCWSHELRQKNRGKHSHLKDPEFQARGGDRRFISIWFNQPHSATPLYT
jgi:hypothetical protein